MDVVDRAADWLAGVWDWFYEGIALYAPGSPGPVDWVWLGVQIGIIALIMTLMMRAYAAVLVFTLLGTAFHVLADIITPMVLEDAPFAAPPIASGLYWQYLSFLLAAYFLAITVLYAFKRAVSAR